MEYLLYKARVINVHTYIWHLSGFIEDLYLDSYDKFEQMSLHSYNTTKFPCDNKSALLNNIKGDIKHVYVGH